MSSPTYLSDLSEERVDKLFKELDVNKDGMIDIKDLTAALHVLRVPQIPKHAEKFIQQHDLNKSGDITYGEFVSFVKERERDLKITFEHFDKDRDGKISIDEIKSTFRELGLELSNQDCSDLLSKLDREKSLSISWNDWREFFLLHPTSAKITDIVHYWNHAVILDVGEAGVIPDWSTEKSNLKGFWWRNLVAGALAGAVSRTATAPIDRLKIFLQVYGANFGIASAFKKLLREGGSVGMFRGNFVNVLKIAPETAVKFACFERMKKIISSNSEIGPLERFLAGSTAGAVAQSAIYPMEVIKTRLALGRTGEYRGIVDCTYRIFKNEGFQSFYRGYMPSIIGIVPYAGIDLAVYETLRNLYSKKGEEPSVFITLGCGVVSSTAAQLASFPLNVLRTNMQAKAHLGDGRDTMSGLFMAIWREDGIRGLYRGLVPSIMKTAPAISITYVVYEKVRKHLGVE